MLSSFSAPPKTVPLPLKIQDGLPRMDVNLLSAAMNEPAVKQWATSRCTALVEKQVKKKPQRFASLLTFRTMSGPK